MGSGSAVLLFHMLLVSLCLYGTSSRAIIRRQWSNSEELSDIQHKSTRNKHILINGENTGTQGQEDCQEMHVNEGDHQKKISMHMDDHAPSHMDHMDPALNVFFTINDLKVGKKMPIYFPIKDPSTSPHLLPREEADSIPFSLAKLPYLLEFFSFSDGSPQAKAMEDTLRHCEHEPLKGETKFCATSLESMLDSAHGVFGSDTKLKVLTTNHLTEPTTLLQNYTISERPKEILAPRIVACHGLPYPYAVYYCHSQESDNKLLMVSLVGEDGGRVEAAAICHLDTSQWDPNHLAFQVLRTRPGDSPVCHFFPADNLIWIPSSSEMK